MSAESFKHTDDEALHAVICALIDVALIARNVPDDIKAELARLKSDRLAYDDQVAIANAVSAMAKAWQ